jgi:ribonuclease HI
VAFSTSPNRATSPRRPRLAATRTSSSLTGARADIPALAGPVPDVVRVDAVSGAPELIWSAAMSHAHRSTTNNQAEYHGLITGLRAARHYQWSQLEVVGDSALVLRQIRDFRPPKDRCCLRSIPKPGDSDQLGVQHWSHHVRAHNKMADALANLAMDCRASSQVTHPSARSGHCGLSAHLSTDLRPWLADAVGRHGALSVAF